MHGDWTRLFGTEESDPVVHGPKMGRAHHGRTGLTIPEPPAATPTTDFRRSSSVSSRRDWHPSDWYGFTHRHLAMLVHTIHGAVEMIDTQR